jgi:hypothetical protein
MNLRQAILAPRQGGVVHPSFWVLGTMALTVMQASAAHAQGLTNEQVLRSWQQQTGQAFWAQDSGQIEFHGATSLDIYSNQVRVPSTGSTGTNTFSSLHNGDFARGLLQGDVRSTNAAQATTYVQGVLTSSNDRGMQPRYATQINNFQMGRTGVGYQMAFGDVAAGYSTLSSNLGLRGLLGSKELDKVTLSGFAGTVAESWEALSNRSALDGQAPRTRYLRDVFGTKGEYKLAAEWSAFATAQRFSDRVNTATPLASSVTLPALDGDAISVGAKYQTQVAQLAMEYARSSSKNAISGANAKGDALVLDGSYRWQSFGLRAGFHDLEPEFVSLAQSVAPGIRETYAGGDWQITPQLTWSIDLRDSITRIATTGQRSELDSQNNRLTYNLTNIPGLSLNLSDTRNQGQDGLGNQQRNDLSQAGVNYGGQVWTANLSAGAGRVRNPQSPAADGTSRQWQAALGRHFSDASLETQANYQLLVQGTASSQRQKFAATGADATSNALGLNVSLQTTRYGALSAQWQRQQNTQPIAGAPDLYSSLFNLDWARQITESWSFKAFARVNRRNHGDANLRVDERSLGVQAGYKW